MYLRTKGDKRTKESNSTPYDNTFDEAGRVMHFKQGGTN